MQNSLNLKIKGVDPLLVIFALLPSLSSADTEQLVLTLDATNC